MDIRAELDLVIRARYPLLCLVSYEEERVARTLSQVAATQGKDLYVWTVTTGLAPYDSNVRPPAETRDPLGVLDQIECTTRSALYLLKDLHYHLGDVNQGIVTRKLRDLATALRRTRATVILLSPVLRLPPELSKEVVVLDFPLPTEDELEALLGRITGSRIETRLSETEQDRLLKAALGLTEIEAERAFLRAIQQRGQLDGGCIELVQDAKKQIIRQSGVLEYFDTTETLTSVGGLEILKQWLRQRQGVFSPRARRYGLPQPKGLVLLGVQGCGKSLTAKTIASLWRLPLLRLDIGRVFGGLVGESEAKIRQAIATAEAVSPCILWIDELDKAFGGMKGYQGDSGTQLRVFGSFITWLQEKEKPVFVVATANNPNVLPAELLRKGRFDEIFFVNLPQEHERHDIFAIHLRKRDRSPRDFDLDQLAAATENFSGAEIEQLVIEALHVAFAEGEQPLTTQHIWDQIYGAPEQDIEPFVPLSQMMEEEITALRRWARGRARRASRVDN